jgi:hypothetical protein
MHALVDPDIDVILNIIIKTIFNIIIILGPYFI